MALLWMLPDVPVTESRWASWQQPLFLEVEMLPGQLFTCLGLAAPRACGFILSGFLSSVQPLVSFRTAETESALLCLEDSHGKGCCYYWSTQ